MDTLARLRMTVAELDLLENDDLEPVLRRKVWTLLGDEASRWTRRLRRMTKGQRMFWILPIVEEEVHNGGFHQYFWNQFGRFAPDALEGLRRVGAYKHADVLQDAMETFLGESELQDRIRRDGSLEAFAAAYRETRLTSLDPVWWNLSKSVDLEALRVRYARKHLQEFVDA
jgi:hypothetical protein